MARRARDEHDTRRERAGWRGREGGREASKGQGIQRGEVKIKCVFVYVSEIRRQRKRKSGRGRERSERDRSNAERERGWNEKREGGRAATEGWGEQKSAQ